MARVRGFLIKYMKSLLNVLVALFALVGVASIVWPLLHRKLFNREWSYYHSLTKVDSIRTFGISAYEGNITSAIWLTNGGYLKLGGADRSTLAETDHSWVHAVGDLDLKCDAARYAENGFVWPTLVDLSEILGRPGDLTLMDLIEDYDAIEAKLATWPRDRGSGLIKSRNATDCWAVVVEQPVQNVFVDVEGFVGSGWLYFQHNK